MEEEEEIEEIEAVEKPKKKLSPKQLENLTKGRERLRKKVELTVEQKAQKKLEDRFDKLVSMFEKVQLPSPDIQQQVKAKRVIARKPESESDEEIVVEKARPAKRPVVVIQPSRPTQKVRIPRPTQKVRIPRPTQKVRIPRPTKKVGSPGRVNNLKK